MFFIIPNSSETISNVCDISKTLKIVHLNSLVILGSHAILGTRV